MTKATVTDIVSHLSSLNLIHGKLVTHESTLQSSWRDALAKSSDVPQSFQLVKTLVFKPKTSKTAPQTPVVVFAREETETSSAALGRKFNLKDLRLAPEDLLISLFGVNKDASTCQNRRDRFADDRILIYISHAPSVSPLSVTKKSFPTILTIIDASLASSEALFAVHPSASDSTLFLRGVDIAAYLKTLETADVKVINVDFEAIKQETLEPIPG